MHLVLFMIAFKENFSKIYSKFFKSEVLLADRCLSFSWFIKLIRTPQELRIGFGDVELEFSKAAAQEEKNIYL